MQQSLSKPGASTGRMFMFTSSVFISMIRTALAGMTGRGNEATVNTDYVQLFSFSLGNIKTKNNRCVIIFF